ncbi:MAG: hypothetical protein NTY17_11185 [Planctomycetia bacterium]|nr:hypothetical protein [Planctomycetia bacterium]
MQLPLATCVLFAAGFDWLEALLPFLFVAFWIVSQVFAVFRRLQGGGRQQPPPLPPRPRFEPVRDRPRPPQPVGDDAADSRSVLEKQIAEFLREATGEKKPQPTMQKSEPGAATRPQPPRPERRADADRRAPQTPRAAAPVRREREPKKNAATREAAARITETAPQQPQPQSESVARHVQDAFSRELTHLRGAITQDEPQAGAAPRTSTPTQAEELMHLLRNPVTVRQVILLREILDRPVDRW